MNRVTKQVSRLLIAGIVFLMLVMNLHAWEPNAIDLDAAISAGDFTRYFGNLSTWLNQKVPADSGSTSEAAMKALLKHPVVALALDQRQILSKFDLHKLGAFARADNANKPFLAWILKNTQVMDLYLEGATPVKTAAREDNGWSLSVGTLEIWKKIYYADPDSRQGLYLRLAIATALRPPGTGNRGAGMQKQPSDPVVRYKYFKSAHKNKELFPSFDNLTVWEYEHVVSSCASEGDLTWGREMVNTWNPDFRKGERVVETTSQVWRRNSPIPFTNGFKSVMEGGGQCGPRSSWAVFICQAFGIPAIGVGQPGHACVAYKSLEGWKVAYGKGWNASHLEGMSGPEFVAGVEAREHAAAFSQVEHLRWLASALASREQAAAVMRVAGAVAKSTPATKRDLTASEMAEEANAEPGATSPPKQRPPQANKALASTTKPEAPFKPAPGVIHVDAASFIEQGGEHCFGGQYRGVPVVDCYTGGKQLHFQANMASAWVGYKINVPATGIYELAARVAVVNSGQSLYVRSFGSMAPVKKGTASTVYKGMVKDLGPQQTIDGNPGTRWAVNENIDKCWLELDLGQPTAISTVMIDERAWNRVSKFQVEYKVGNDWKTIFEGTNIGIDFSKDFSPVTARYVRLNILDNRQGGPTIWEFSVGTVKDGRAWINLPCTYGLWQTTQPVDIRLCKGPHTIWIFAPFQRGVSLKWFELKPKAMGRSSISELSQEVEFAPVAARHVRLNLLETTDGPSIREFQLLAPGK